MMNNSDANSVDEKSPDPSRPGEERSQANILLARARELSKPLRHTTRQIYLRCLEFSISDMLFAFKTQYVMEILRNTNPITHLPFLPPYFSGLVNVRGAILPVVDMAVCLDIDRKNEKNENLVVLQKDDMVLAFVCGSRIKIRELIKKEIQVSIAAVHETIGTLAIGYARGGTVVLDADAFFAKLSAGLKRQ